MVQFPQHCMKSLFLCLLSVACLLPTLAAEVVSGDAVAAKQSEWQRRCADRWSGNIVWNEKHTAAVAWQEVGGDCYSYNVWCFRADESGCMQPVAFVTAQSDAAFLNSIEFMEDEMIILNMADKENILFRYAFEFRQRYGSMRWLNNDLRMISERKPALESQPDYEAVKALSEGL